MKPGRKPGHRPSPETREKIRQARLGRTHAPETKEKIRETLRGVPKSTDHRDRISSALLDLEAKCLRRFEELKQDYPEHHEFFDANKSELLRAMQDVRSEKELKDLRRYIEVSQVESTLSYDYPSTSYLAAEDTFIALIDAKRILERVIVAVNP